MSGAVVIPEAIVYPASADLEDPHPDLSSFRVLVKYRGRGLWCVTTDPNCAVQMTHTGKWLTFPLRMTQMRWCRFPYEQALALAQEHAPRLTVHGLTWDEWEQFGHVVTPEARALIRQRYEERTLI